MEKPNPRYPRALGSWNSLALGKEKACQNKAAADFVFCLVSFGKQSQLVNGIRKESILLGALALSELGGEQCVGLEVGGTGTMSIIVEKGFIYSLPSVWGTRGDCCGYESCSGKKYWLSGGSCQHVACPSFFSGSVVKSCIRHSNKRRPFSQRSRLCNAINVKADFSPNRRNPNGNGIKSTCLLDGKEKRKFSEGALEKCRMQRGGWGPWDRPWLGKTHPWPRVCFHQMQL